eukprot:UN03557
MAQPAKDEIKKAQRLSQQQAAQQQNMQQKVKEAQAKREKQEQLMDQRRVILKAILSHGAQTRLSNLKLVNEERAIQVENMLIQQSQTGMISGKVTENHVKMLLEQLSEKNAKKTGKVKIDRKKLVNDPDEVDLDNLWPDDD